MDAEVDTELMQNVFDNLWRFDDKLNIVPDIATAVPTQANGGISADGLTYTVHLNPAAKFSNGDPVTSKDVLYSWNRAAALHGAIRLDPGRDPGLRGGAEGRRRPAIVGYADDVPGQHRDAAQGG